MDLKAVIDVPSAVIVRTLSRADVTSYLQGNESKYVGLLQALQAEPAMWELMDTPLMLWVGV